jgi:hypothetical protein
MNTLVILAILVLGCLALDIVILIITMQLMVRIEDVVPSTYVEVRLYYYCCRFLTCLYIITKYYVAKKFNSCYWQHNIVATPAV